MAAIDTIQNYRSQIVAAVAVIILLIVGAVVYYSFFVFHISSITPDLKNVSYLTPQIVVTFNKPIASDSVRISSDSITALSSKVDGKKLTVSFSQAFTPNKKYSFVINSIESTSKNQIKNRIVAFIPSSDDSSLSDADRALILNRQDTTKPAVLNDPIFKYIPHSTLDYSIDGTITGTTVAIVITIPLSASDISTGRTAAIEAYTQEAKDYLNTLQGIDISKYSVTVSIVDPS